VSAYIYITALVILSLGAALGENFDLKKNPEINVSTLASWL